MRRRFAQFLLLSLGLTLGSWQLRAAQDFPPPPPAPAHQLYLQPAPAIPQLGVTCVVPNVDYCPLSAPAPIGIPCYCNVNDKPLDGLIQ